MVDGVQIVLKVQTPGYRQGHDRSDGNPVDGSYTPSPLLIP